MKTFRILLFAFPFTFLVACGEVATPETGSDAGGSVSGDSGQKTSSTASLGTVFAQVTNEITANGIEGHLVGANIRTGANASGACDGATLTVGACCYVPGAAAVDSGTSGVPAGENPDGGYTSVGVDVGSIAVADGTSSTTLATLQYGPIPSGFGVSEGYASDLIDPTVWNDGDTITFAGIGHDQFQPFSAQVRAVAFPDIANPTSISRANGLTLSWTPDANAKTMTVSLASYGGSASHGTVTCDVPDSAASVAIDASLLVGFDVGDNCWLTAEREATQDVEVGASGHVTIAAQGLDEVVIPVE